ncbi:sulfatase family protein [Gelidibacter salicanalis]|uniref:Sulfatase-like hydrolase/transferase n=1 Tax=Gelidibacter salicanalis TaxID=291193 RepID=A0A934NJQ0_9FLAO|nr:sulfatase-like hydrolase/transferase [Gelidibacter salicanalis]MBJ7882988.1 sulfatase-like hydrolase/transferase [Gelidibacter salicanalis]
MKKTLSSNRIYANPRIVRLLMFSLTTIFVLSCKETVDKNSDEPEDISNQDRPNIVLIMTDQHQAEALSIAGNLNLKTPNLDKLATSGVRFENAYVTFPLCSPSRSSMFTGQLPHQLGVNSNADTALQKNVANTSLAQVLKSNGYDCAYGGKWHAPEVEIEDNSGFDKISEFGDLNLAENSIAFLKSKAASKTPFFLVASFDNPHTICEWARNQPLPYGNIKPVPLEETPTLPINFKKSATFPEALQYEQAADVLSYPTKHYTEADWRQYRYTYYRLIEKVDHEIGKIIDAIDALGLRDNTIIIFTSDHGDGNASHGWNQKTALFQESINVPLIISDKTVQIAQKTTKKNLVSTGLDLYSTVLDYAGISTSDTLLGKSIRPMISLGNDRENHDFVVTETKFDSKNGYGTLGRAVIDKQYKYVLYSWGKHREQFFDLAADPFEMNNLANAQDHFELMDSYRQKLITWCQKTNDTQFLKRAILPSTTTMSSSLLFDKPY